MGESHQGIVIFIIILLVFSVSINLMLNKIFLVAMLTSLCTSITFQYISYLHLGHLDPFYIIALITTCAISFFFSLIIGFVISYLKNKIKQPRK